MFAILIPAYLVEKIETSSQQIQVVHNLVTDNSQNEAFNGKSEQHKYSVSEKLH